MAGSFLTVAEIADWLKVDPQVVRNLIALGLLPAVRMESHEVRVKTADLERFVATFTRWQREDVAETTEHIDPAARGQASARDRFAHALAEIFRAAASLEQLDLSSQLRALAAAAEEFACELDAVDAPKRPMAS
jgi:excisionase family DNA binding protein